MFKKYLIFAPVSLAISLSLAMSGGCYSAALSSLEPSTECGIQALECQWKQKEEFRQKLQAAHEGKQAILKAKTAEMDAYLKYMEAAKQFRGAVLIQQAGIPIFSGAYGPSDAKGKPNTLETGFCIASMTKQFTGTAVALLMQDTSLITNPEVRTKLGLDDGGQLALDTPINDLLSLKYQNSEWGDITLEHLLRHTSGLSTYGPEPDDEQRLNNFTLDEIIVFVKQGDLLFTPGEMWSYSNKGYALLGAIVENLSNSTLEAFMQEHIFAPCHMNHTGFVSSYDAFSVAKGFCLEEGALVQIESMERHLSKAYAAGGLITTVYDLGEWDRALRGPSLLTDATKEMMFSCPAPVIEYAPRDLKLRYQKDENGRVHPVAGQKYPECCYGFGMQSCYDEKTGPFLCHSGSIVGFTGVFARFIPSRITLIMLTNHGENDLRREISHHLHDILFAGEES